MYEDFNFDFDDDDESINESFENSCKKIKLDECSSSSNSLDKSPMKIVKRRYPGPAGLLPLKNKTLINNSELQNSSSHDDNTNTILCSQQSHLIFEEGGPWNEMVKDFITNTKESQLYEKFNINWIKINSGKGKLLNNEKAPFLAAIIDNLEVIDGKIKAINVNLKDKTGRIKSTVLHSLYEEFKDYFTVGSILVLRKFGVVTVQKERCITITRNNLLRIYHNEILENHVKKIIINECGIEEIWAGHQKLIMSRQENKNNNTNTKKHVDNFPKNDAAVNETSKVEGNSRRETLKKNDEDNNREILKSFFEEIDVSCLFDDF